MRNNAYSSDAYSKNRLIQQATTDVGEVENGRRDESPCAPVIL